MIKFFRQIRYKLMSKNKTGRYLKYAIGEIILVVIGILIALQVNNWNEERKANNELLNIKENLLQEFEANRNELQNVLKSVDYTKNGGLDILAVIGEEKINVSEEEFNKMIEKSLFFPTWKPKNFTLNELKNTGKLILIKNDTLKRLLFNWEKHISIIEEWNRRVEKSSQDIIDYIKAYGSIRNINHKRIETEASSLNVSNMALFDDVRFENQIDEKVLYAQFMKQYLEEADDIISEILEKVTQQ
ncbi:DUF6090 family protein [Winogradskyella ouciana]|uniref:DUF6090 family protein n=1 Tax=Winogradskyella ouciana TaxID=2608631 RepID=UPI00192E7045|nr:DUF6090 family protein [Winogradskyella ouciana]